MTFDRKAEIEKMIEGYEGRKLKAYLCDAGIPTIGIGTTRYPNGVKVKLGDKCTNDQAEIWLRLHLVTEVYPLLKEYENGVPDRVYVSLASFVYNIGRVGDSLKAALAKKDWNELAVAFKKYIYSNGQKSNGLIKRRANEVKYFMEGL